MYHFVALCASLARAKKTGRCDSGPLGVLPGRDYWPRFRRALAAMRMRRAFNLMKPPASAWL